MKMWIALTSMGFMFISVFSIYFSRYKLKGVLKMIFTAMSFIFMVLAGILIFLVVFTGPVPE
ncbi:DUF2768 domain-containing protein [Metabacillus fastidiosus]|uniref:DUF2768 domain-containing protein n=1 Tax=Metabacillus fastidiosus TaxID=1458 RepID=A0ABU6NU97_9BACI|nr:DUF2768 domain-containing protein [Metabacillus fastidiosus]MED4400718.1 DUF2768 domain-containing protein [Metabacillus fastidiosus]MED4453707.1 DUF2768 domain-containing protein [Metabacillus fastidiosus]MED4462889.1 DUF2768 domain-containing protein [Metabacillus fastidiosus]